MIQKQKKSITSDSPQTILKQCFQNNYYSSQEFISFIQTLTHQSATTIKLSDTTVTCIKNTCLSIAPYSDQDTRLAIQKKLRLQRILPHLNTDSSVTKKTVLEYSILPKATYKQVFDHYHKNFRTQVRQAEKNDLAFSFFDSEQDLTTLGLGLEDIYTIYKDQMKRLYSFQFPYSYFTTCLLLPHARGAVVTTENTAIAYAILFENEDNIYISMAGADFAHAQLRPANLLYDRIIQYACKQHKHIHCGMGSSRSGGNRFKRKAGFIPFQIQMIPHREKTIERFESLSQKPVIRTVSRFLLKHWSTHFPESFFRSIIPFT